jgi:hypothetical protein
MKNQITDTGLDIRETHSSASFSLKFRDDGSIVVKKGSTTIIKNKSSATVKGDLVKEFKLDVVENIGLVQGAFTS